MKKRIAFIVDQDHKNSIVGYALTLFEALQQSAEYEYVLHSVPFTQKDSYEKIANELNGFSEDAIIYNWYPSYTNWVFDHVMSLVNKPQFVIGGHNHTPQFETPKHQWSVYTDIEPTDRLTPLARPIITYPDIKYSPPEGRIKIGSFGLGDRTKNYPKIVEMVNQQFNDVVVDLNFHMSYTAHTYAATNGEAQKCRDIVAPNVNLNITFDYLKTSYEIVKFLNGNDLNVFLYEDQPFVKATSSSLDHAISARKPIALARSSYFSHVNVPGVWVEERGLHDILNDGIAPWEPFIKAHSTEALLNSVELYLKKYV